MGGVAVDANLSAGHADVVLRSHDRGAPERRRTPQDHRNDCKEKNFPVDFSAHRLPDPFSSGSPARRESFENLPLYVNPAKAGVQKTPKWLDTGLRWYDGSGHFRRNAKLSPRNFRCLLVRQITAKDVPGIGNQQKAPGTDIGDCTGKPPPSGRARKGF
jgi:hypothetical protein